MLLSIVSLWASTTAVASIECFFLGGEKSQVRQCWLVWSLFDVLFVCGFFGSFVCQIFYAVFISPSVAYWVQWMLSLFVLRFCLAWSHQHITLVCYFCSIRHHTSPHSFKKRMCETNNEDHFVKHCTAQLTILNDTHFLINTLCVCHIGSQWPLSLFGWIWFVCLHSCYL